MRPFFFELNEPLHRDCGLGTLGHLVLCLLGLVLKKRQVKKAIPVTGREGLYVYDMSRIPHCLDNRPTDGGYVVSLTRGPCFTLKKIWY
jgi:hypothetical protein